MPWTSAEGASGMFALSGIMPTTVKAPDLSARISSQNSPTIDLGCTGAGLYLDAPILRFWCPRPRKHKRFLLGFFWWYQPTGRFHISSFVHKVSAPSRIGYFTGFYLGYASHRPEQNA